MNAKIYKSRHAMGRRVIGEALVAHDGFSARYDLNRLDGVFSRPTHKLVGQSYVGKILVLDTAKGGVASAWMLRETGERKMAPKAILFERTNTILAQGGAFAGLAMLDRFETRFGRRIVHAMIACSYDQARATAAAIASAPLLTPDGLVRGLETLTI